MSFCLLPVRPFALTVILTVAAPFLWTLPARAEGPMVAFGTKHAVALRNNGEVLTWGDNVFCELGRQTSGNRAATPTVVMRNVKEIAVANAHNFALTADGKLYAWGGNPAGVLGMGDEYERCEGPELVSSLADKTIAHVSTGYNFAVAVTTSGNLYCAGENDMSQCPSAGKGGDTPVFARVPFPELAGKVRSVTSGTFHTLVLTTDGALYAFGRGLDGQLGNGQSKNGFAAIPGLRDVVSMSAGTWHSAAVRADGSAWLWGKDHKSQLCDGATTNRATPMQVTLPASLTIAQVVANGHSTIMRTTGGALYACGDNQWGHLGLGTPTLVPQPTLIPVPAAPSLIVALGGAYAAVSVDGCAVRVSGDSSDGILSEAANTPVTLRTFTARASLTLCGTRPAQPEATLVREWPKGGQAGCWAPRVEEDGARNPRFTGLRAAMLATEALFMKHAAFISPLKPSRFRTSLSAGPSNESGAHMHVKVVPERKDDLTRLWTGSCGVIPQLERIGGASAHVSVFFNSDARGQFIGPSGELPKLTGQVAGYPEYDHWILITKNGRLPWIPQTLGDRLDIIGAKREKAIVEWNRTREQMKPQDPASIQRTYEMLKKTDPAGAETFLASAKETADEIARQQREVMPARTAVLEKQLQDYRTYRASFTAEQLSAAAVAGDPSGQERRQADARIAALRILTPDDQRQADAWGQESRTLERQAQAETKSGNVEQAAVLRAQANALAQRVRTLRTRHQERSAAGIENENAQYELISLKPGPAEQAIAIKPDPAFPNMADPNRIQVITITFGMDSDPRSPRRAWQQQIKDTFDYAALAALLQ